MLNFKNLVENILVEQIPPTPGSGAPGSSETQYPVWFKSILDKHKALGLGEVKEGDIRQLFNTAFKPYISEQDAKLAGKNILILDVIKVIYDSVTPKPAKTQDAFLKSPEVEQIGETMAQTINTYTQKDQWQIENAFVANAYRQAKPTLSSTIGKVAGAVGALRVGMGPVN